MYYSAECFWVGTFNWEPGSQKVNNGPLLTARKEGRGDGKKKSFFVHFLSMSISHLCTRFLFRAEEW
jgi:hypothetical protein